jgi:tetratricopeptide (TPR) repeat protein
VLALWRLAGSKVGAVVVAVLAMALGATTVARNREYATPLSLAQTIVDRRPSGPAHHMLGEQLAILRRLDEAIVQLQRAVDLGNTRARYPLGRVLIAKGDLQGGVAQLEAVVRLDGRRQPLRWLEPPLIEVLSSRLLLGQVYGANRRWLDAETQARAVLARVPAHTEARRILAASLAGQQRWPESISEHRQYLQARPDDAQARVNLGISLVATGQLEAAAQEFRLAVQAEPDNANAKRLLALAEEDLRQAAAARR